MIQLFTRIAAFSLLLAAAFSSGATSVQIPGGAVGWWRAEGDNLDALGNGAAVVPGGAAFAPGFVGQAFSFMGGETGVMVGKPTGFQVQNLTIEAWIKRADATSVSQSSPAAAIFGGGSGSYALSILTEGELVLGKVNLSNVYSTTKVKDTNWHHVAVTKESTNVTFYVDGVSAGSAVYAPVFDFNTPFAIGSLGATVGAYNFTFWGLIDEVGLYDRALSSAEIGAIYGAGSAGKGLEVIKATVNSLSTVRVGADFKARFAVENQGSHPATNVLLNVNLPTGYTLTAQAASLGANVVSDSSVQNMVAILPPGEAVTITLTGHGNAPSALAFHGQVSRSGAGPTSSDGAADLTVSVIRSGAGTPDGIVGWWRAEGDKVDAIGNGTNAGSAGVTFVPGVVGQAFSFAGDVPGVVVGGPAAFQLQNFTIEAWIRRSDATKASQTVYYGAIFSGGLGGYGLLLGADGTLATTIVSTSQTSSTGMVKDTEWHHVAVTKDGTDLRFYIDGSAAGSVIYDQPYAFEKPFAVGSLGAPHGYNYTFLGAIDEPSLYNRALTGDEIHAIYAAGSDGKNLGNLSLKAAAPAAVQPGEDFAVTFSVSNAGTGVATNVVVEVTLPADFKRVADSVSQGQNDLVGTSLRSTFGILLPGENATATISGHVSFPTNAVFTGRAASDDIDVSPGDSLASLNVEILPPCDATPEGLLLLLRGEGNPGDTVSHFSSATGVGYGPGRVGQAFVFNGAGEVAIPDSADLDVNSFTIEAWVYPTLLDGSVEAIANKEIVSTVVVSPPESAPYFVTTVDSQFAFGIKGPLNDVATNIPLGSLIFSLRGLTSLPNDYSGWTDAKAVIPLSQWSHVALTVTADTATTYVNGAATRRLTGLSGALTMNRQPLRIGSLYPDLLAQPKNHFNGLIDEFSYYSRALGGEEITALYQAGGAGKCAPAVVPTVLSGPTNQTVPAGQEVTFRAVAVGTQPLTYQWKFNGANLIGATNSILTLPAVRQSAVGTYEVTVCNPAGCAPPISAKLTVTPVPAMVAVVDSAASALGTVEVPLRLIGNGVENTLSFTVRFDTNRLTYAAADLGTDAAEGQLLVNEAQAAQGVLGISLALPPGSAFSKETNDVLRLKFDTAAVSGDVAVPLTLVSGITPQKILDTNGVALPATWGNGTVTIRAINFEADVSPLAGGDRQLDISDWTQVGRYVAALEDLSPGVIFQRADCAPLASAGEGVLTVSDWVQAGRFAVGLDLPVAAGGPADPQSFIPAPLSASRVVRLVGGALLAGQIGEISVTLTASGVENAAGFSLSYDPAVLTFVGAVKGAGSQKASLNVNTRQTAGGKVAATLALNPGSKFPAGTLEIARLQFKAGGAGNPSANVAFADFPVGREVASALAEPLPTTWEGISLGVTPPTVNARPVTTPDGPAIELSWPATHMGAMLEKIDTLSGGNWLPVDAAPTVSNGQNTVVVPLTGAAAYFHLKLP
jgi:uncharacterized repeat protein (TIGR01451 family)